MVVGVGTGCSAETQSPTPRPDADVPAAREAITTTRAAISAITTTLARHPQLEDRLSPLLAMHRAHLRRLRTIDAGHGRAKPTTEKVPAAADRALARIRAAEAARATRLDALARTAHSGGFARMLASMSASIGQHTGAAA